MSLIDLSGFDTSWPFRTGSETFLSQPVQPDVAKANLAALKTAIEALDAAVVALNTDDVVYGPASVTDERIAVFDGTTGKLLKQASVTVSGLATVAQGTLADSALQPADISGGTITAATGNLDLTGSQYEVLMVDGSGNVVPTAVAAENVTSNPVTTGISGETDVEGALTSLKTGFDILEAAIAELGIDAISGTRSWTTPTPVANEITLTLTDLASRVSDTTVFETVVGMLNSPGSVAMTTNLPVDASPGDAFLLYHDEAQTASVTIRNVGAVGSINGASTYVSNSPAAFIVLFCKNNPGSAPVWRIGTISELMQVLFKGYTENVSTLTATDTSAIAFSYTGENSNSFKVTLQASPSAFSITNVPSGEEFSLKVTIVQDGTGTHTWPVLSGVIAVGGVHPTIDDSANAVTKLLYEVDETGAVYVYDGGTSWSAV